MFRPYYKSGEKPNKFQLMQKDIGVNLVDKILFFKDLNQQIVEIGSGTTETITSEGTGTEYAIKQPDGTLIIVIPEFTAVQTEVADQLSMYEDIIFPVSFIDTNYSIALSITGGITMATGGNEHKAMTSAINKTASDVSLGIYVVTGTAVFEENDSVVMSATLTGRWK